MNCQRFETVVSELARSQMMEAEVRAAALAHSEECARCFRRLRDEETLTRGLQLLAGETESLAAPGEIELELREAFRNRRASVPVTKQAGSRYWLMAVAAMLLVAMSVAAMWWRSTGPQKEIADVTPPSKQEEVNRKPETLPKDVEYRADNLPPRRETPKPVRRHSASRKPAATPMANHMTREIATDFMSLGYMNPAALQDGGQIVRVQLPRSTLASFGFPVNMEHSNEKVKADILMGVDGRAQAIRFVQ